MDSPFSYQRGFTLIELSIVLVIIGLIVGGVLVGRDMIHAAEIRATVTQIEKFNTAVHTFQFKYDGLPGDLLYSKAQAFGMTVTGGMSAGNRDGDGLIEACGPTVIGTSTRAGCETILFWSDLSVAKLIEGTYTGGDSPVGLTMLQDNQNAPSTLFSQLHIIEDTEAFPQLARSAALPAAKLGNNYVIVYGDADGLNYYEITGVGPYVNGGPLLPLTNNLTPQDVFQIDAKVDDGLPLTGIVIATEGASPDTIATPGASTCVFTGGAQYNTTTSALATTNLCHLRLRMQ